MKISLIARADDRGLGRESHDFFTHLKPHRTLVVDVGNRTPYPQHFDRYPGAKIARWDERGLIEHDALQWLVEGCDVVLTFETSYDPSLFDRAREAGCKTVLRGNHEFFPWAVDRERVRPDLFVTPCSWMADSWPAPTIMMPTPVDRKRFAFRQRSEAGTFLHVVGHPAAYDRQGTRLIQAALAYIHTPIRLVILSQSRSPGMGSGKRRNVQVEQRIGSLEEAADLYQAGDVLLAPRRYGGQSLPLQEAMSCGLAVIALDRVPENEMLAPESLVPRTQKATLNSQGGPVGIDACHPRHLAAKIEELARDASLVERLSKESDTRAEALSWEVLGPKWRALLESVC